MLNELNNKIGILEEKFSSLGQYLLSTGTAQIDGVVVRSRECKIYEFIKHLSGLYTNKNGVVFNTSDISN